MLFAARAEDVAAPSQPTVTVVSSSPQAELMFHGLSLKSARASDSENEIALDFDAPLQGNVFDALQQTLPDWIAMAYAGYDFAVIRARRPVSFLARRESDGFSLSFLPRPASPAAAPPDATIRGDVADARAQRRLAMMGLGAQVTGRSSPAWRAARNRYATALAERPDDVVLRAGYDLASPRDELTAKVEAGWRADHDHSTVYRGRAEFAVPLYQAVGDAIGLEAHADSAYAHAASVRRLNGTFTALDRGTVSGGVGGTYFSDNGAVVKAEALYGGPGAGALLSVDWESPFQRIGARGAYHQTDLDTAEAVANDAARDFSEVDAAGEILDGLWASADLRATRYGVHGDADLARTAGFTASLAYAVPVYDQVEAGLRYVADGEYTLAAHRYAGVAPSPFIPLSIRTREVHTMTGALDTQVLGDVWLDAYGGYAIDRYANRGAVYGGAVRFALFPDFDILVSAQHTEVADRQGEKGPETSAELTFAYR